MQRILLVFSLFLTVIPQSFAAPGDTTWVTIFENRQIDHYGNFDTIAQLPADGIRYRKIRLHYILGRYNCPAGSQYCGSWDYTTMVYALPPDADTVELARVITPYATDWNVTRKHDYIVDLSDYATILHDELPIQFQYEGYSWGFTLTLKIEFIEGTPPRDALGASNVYDGYFAYGKTSDPIENHLTPKTVSYVAPAANAFLKNSITGHGMDSIAGCSEFCSKYYRQLVNGNLLEQKQLWKSDCGSNNVYPQTGTWIFNRANWCPGEAIIPVYHNLDAVTEPDTAFDVNMDLEDYTSLSQGNTGGYNIVSQLISYSAPNFALDASIEDIIAPTDDPNYARSNGICNSPVIRIKNSGTTPLTALTFTYGLDGGITGTYNWTGNLAFLEEAVVDFGSNPSIFSGNESNRFHVELTAVNGQAQDENRYNDTYRSTFNHVRAYPSLFRVYFKTNNASSPTNPGFNESNWRIYDDAGNVVASRVNNANNTLYIDTLELADGCYTFVMEDDSCDGVSWWYYPYYDNNPGNGSIRFIRESSLSPWKTFNGDFGCRITERFTIGYLLDVEEKTPEEARFDLFPNPANDQVTVVTDKKGRINYFISDTSGKVMTEGLFKDQSTALEIETKSLTGGIYMLWCRFEDGSMGVQRFVVSR